MNGHATRIDRRDAGRSHDRHLFQAILADMFQESCLPRTGFPGEKDISGTFIHQLHCQAEELIVAIGYELGQGIKFK